MKTNGIKNSADDFIVEENGNIYYVLKPKKKKNTDSFLARFPSFVQKNLLTSDKELYSKPRDVSRLQMFTFLVINNGPNPILCQAELSPDGITWGTFGELEYTVSPGNLQVIVPQHFLRFARIKYINKIPGFNSVITIWFQGQKIADS